LRLSGIIYITQRHAPPSVLSLCAPQCASDAPGEQIRRAFPEAKVVKSLNTMTARSMLGDITTARGAEMVLPPWVSLMGKLGTPLFNFKIAK
jgi:8-hydroxy-5-deazaflavin:NADPH oxidoreductase